MTFSISFNGVDLSDLVNGFTSIERNFGATWTNNLGPIGISRYGQEFINNYSGPKTIVVNFRKDGVPRNWIAIRQKMAQILNVSEPAPLIFGDEPNKIWYAVPDQQPTFSEDISSLVATGTLTFLVPSGIAESSYTQTLNADNSGGENGSIVKNDDGSIDLIINNQGTLPVYPTVTVTHNSDNAYIGIAGEEGVIALGSQEQTLINTVTTETTKVKSQWLLNPGRKNSQSSNFSGHFVNASDVGNPQNGTLKTAGSLSFQKDGLRLASMGPNPSSGTWTFQGGMQVFNVPADSAGDVGTANFRSDLNIWAQATKMGQTGLIQILYCDKNNKLLCGMGIYKDDTKGNTFQIHLYIGGNHQRTWKVFGPKGLELNNGGHGDGKVPNPNRYFNSAEGNFTIDKKGDRFYYTFGNKGGTYSITAPEMATQQCSKVFVYIGQAKGRNMSSQYVTNLTLRRFSFQKKDVKKIIDDTTDATTFIPADDHHYGEGEIVVVNTADANIFRGAGSTFANDELITGGEFFPIPPGESILSLVFGDDAATPDIEVSWKERYL